MTLIAAGFIHPVQGQGAFAEEVHGRSINKSFPRAMWDCTSADFLVEVVICFFGGFYEQAGQVCLWGD